MVLNLTTLARVKSYLEITDGNSDNSIELLIPSISQSIERYLNREIRKTNYTEYFDVEPKQKVFYLKAIPVVVDTLALNYDIDREFPVTNELEDEDFAIYEEEGRVEIDKIVLTRNVWDVQRKVLKATYAGGMASSTELLVSSTSAFLDLELACFEMLGDFLAFKTKGGISSESQGAYSVSYNTLSIPEKVKKILNPLCHPGRSFGVF